MIPVLVLSTWAAQLAGALDHGDVDEVVAIARRAGGAELARIVVGDDRVAARAATLAAPHVADAWMLLDELARRAAGWERAAAVDATVAATAIARRIDGDTAIADDIADDTLDDLATRWRAIAARDDRWSDVRVGALDVAARLARARRATADVDPLPGYDLAALLRDRDPELRRAAAELVPQPTPATLRAELVRAVIDDATPAVAIAAAQAMCGDLGVGDKAAPVLGALGPPGLARIRTILGDAGVATLPPGAVLDAARCLAADATPASRGVLRALAGKAPRAVRSAIGRLKIGKP